MFDTTEIHALLDAAREKYRALFGGKLTNGRSEQFEAAVDRTKMTVDHSADEAEKENTTNG